MHDNVAIKTPPSLLVRQLVSFSDLMKSQFVSVVDPVKYIDLIRHSFNPKI